MPARASVWSILVYVGPILAYAGMFMQTFSPANKRVSCACFMFVSCVKHETCTCAVFVLVSRVMASFMALYCRVRKELP